MTPVKVFMVHIKKISGGVRVFSARQDFVLKTPTSTVGIIIIFTILLSNIFIHYEYTSKRCNFK